MTHRMKKYLVFVVTAVMAASCSNDKTVRINGTFAGVDKDTVYLEMTTPTERSITDTTITNENGEFHFKIKVQKGLPVFGNVLYKESSIPLVLSAGEKITLSSIGNLANNYIAEGSEESGLLQEFNSIHNRNVNVLDSLMEVYSREISSGSDEARIGQILTQYLQAYTKSKQEHIKFIVLHPASMAALYALYQRLPNDKTLMNGNSDILYYKLVADSLETKYPGLSYITTLRQSIEKQQASLDMVADITAKANGDTMPFPEVELPDMFGNIKKLSSMTGNVIIVDFWSVTDPVGTEVNAQMRELYDQYRKSGLEIYQIALGDTKSEWILAVQEQKIPWTTVLDDRGGRGMAAMSYNIGSIPSNVIIDKQGNIAAQNLMGNDLRKKIEQLLK